MFFFRLDVRRQRGLRVPLALVLLLVLAHLAQTDVFGVSVFVAGEQSGLTSVGLKNSLEFDEMVSLLLEGSLHLVQVVFQIGVALGLAHLLLEQPRLESGRRSSKDQKSNYVEVELPWNLRGQTEVVLLG